ncbi:hypothetical protein C440_08552 [Haloferax mucosum ATCC BAA-1512]|uniref:Uncharacterized protein n=1 Tax=Haloferax mucosum ATCC BAA-1512 TaxID=662479 RepID=M0IGY7_9EURY|nr:hypothetical protein [Haloferax mucosum]ELZ95113.1 hypothetical protein C440_08552 [Haloferax mucosum ATCC BAA-1512]
MKKTDIVGTVVESAFGADHTAAAFCSHSAVCLVQGTASETAMRLASQTGFTAVSTAIRNRGREFSALRVKTDSTEVGG